MKKRIVRILLVSFLMITALSGCSKKIDDKDRPSVCGNLQVVEGKLCDKKGNPVILQGVSSYNFAVTSYLYNDDNMKQLSHDWHVNVFRLAIYTDETSGYCTKGSKMQILNQMYDVIERATEYDMYFIIDWHILKDKTPLRYLDEAKEFFALVSDKYKDYNNVIYEICNEPNNTSWADIKEYANTIIPIIRENDPDSVILVGNPDWSSRPDIVFKDPLDYENIMYSYHFYSASHKEDSRKNLELYLKAKLPIFVTEYGVTASTGDAPYDFDSADAWWDLMSKYNVSSCMWSYSKVAEASAMIQYGIPTSKNFSYDEYKDGGKWLIDKLKEGK